MIEWFELYWWKIPFAVMGMVILIVLIVAVVFVILYGYNEYKDKERTDRIKRSEELRKREF